MTRQIAPEALIALEFSGLPFHDSFHGLAVNGRWPPQQSGLPPAFALRVLAVPVLPIVAADGVGPAVGEDDHGQGRRSDVRPIARWADSAIRERKDGSRALFDPPPVHEGGAVDQDVVDLGAAGTKLAAVLQLEREDLLWAGGDRAHAVVFVGIGQAVDPGAHVAAVEVREPERLHERVVERIPVVDLRHRNLDGRHALDLIEPRRPR
jgi:hypothetical protein